MHGAGTTCLYSTLPAQALIRQDLIYDCHELLRASALRLSRDSASSHGTRTESFDSTFPVQGTVEIYLMTPLN
jgi:hypothetical protein